MNFLKTNIAVLSLFMLQASALCAAAQPEQRSLWQRTKDFAAEHPVATCLAGAAAAAGIYQLAVHKFGLPTISDTIKADLITGSHAKKAAPSLMDHLLHGVRLCLYSQPFLPIAICSAMFSQGEISDNVRAASATIERNGLTQTIILRPLMEEGMCTYGPRMILGNDWARRIAPIVFGVGHGQYNVAGMAKCAFSSYIRHRSLQVRPEYMCAPIISHVMHNSIAVGLHYLRAYRAQQSREGN